METGTTVEYIDNQKLICAAVLEIKGQRVRVWTENNHEAVLSINRLCHVGTTVLISSAGRDRIVETLKKKVETRKTLAKQIDISMLWDVLHNMEEWIDLETMTGLCFTGTLTDDHSAAVIRAFFDNRLYFKFDNNRFFPYTEEQLENNSRKQQEAERKARLIQTGSDRVRYFLNDPLPVLNSDDGELIEILKSCYLFGKDGDHYEIGKAVLAANAIDTDNRLFDLLVRIGVWDIDENIEIKRSRRSVDFERAIVQRASELAGDPHPDSLDFPRRDLTMLSVITIDGQATLDFDDALSIEKKGGLFQLGIHIADVGHYIPKNDILDAEAMARSSSIYMPDCKISMIPPILSENFCSLKRDACRPTISIIVMIDEQARVVDYDIAASLVQVQRQLSYYEANQIIDIDPHLIILHNLAKQYRQRRLASGALHIMIPEVNIHIDEGGQILVSRIDRESPGRMMVSELMILANALMADFLSKNGMPAVFRAQGEPKNHILKNNNGSLFEHYMQRKHLSRAILGPKPAFHSGLGLPAYVTATSPIRRYFDLVTQRQIRAALGMGQPYSTDEIRRIIQMIEEPLRGVFRLQFNRQRYWILKYLESRIGGKEEALVLEKRRGVYTLLLPAYMIECQVSVSPGIELKPKDTIQVTIQHANARKDAIAVFPS